MDELYVAYVGERLDRQVIGVATSLDAVRNLVSQAAASAEYEHLASECIGYEGPFTPDKLFI